MAATMGQNKGKRGEREVKDAFVATMSEAEALTNIDGVADKVKRNTTQSDRGGDDIVGIPLLSIEVKRQEQLSVNTWWQQCVKSAQRDKLMPVLVYRQNRRTWRVVTWSCLMMPATPGANRWVRCEMDLADFLAWYRDVYIAWLTSETKAA